MFPWPIILRGVDIYFSHCNPYQSIFHTNIHIKLRTTNLNFTLTLIIFNRAAMEACG